MDLRGGRFPQWECVELLSGVLASWRQHLPNAGEGGVRIRITVRTDRIAMQ
jgi:hypothetical protein